MGVQVVCCVLHVQCGLHERVYVLGLCCSSMYPAACWLEVQNVQLAEALTACDNP
jgi:hypothetical protein